jgi:hypothetical protein
MKKNAQSAIDRLSKEMTKVNTKGSYEDDRFWTLERDKSGNGYAVIRFLAPVEGEDIPWVRLFSHGFQGKGGWFIENCPTTIGGKCPVCEANNELWNSGIEANKKTASDRKRKLSYISNILVISDPAAPQNEGKVFLYKYGKKIFEKIERKMQKVYPTDVPFNPYDFWNGANFQLKIRKVDGYQNYDESSFDSQDALFKGDDAQLEALWKTQYPLKEFTSPSQFKTYSELKTKFTSVLSGSGQGKRAEDDGDDNAGNTESLPPPSSKSYKAPAKSAPAEDQGEEFSEDAMSYFEKLARSDD